MTKYILILSLLLTGCGAGLAPEVMSVTMDMIKFGIEQARLHGQTLPKFAHNCESEYVELEDMHYNVLLSMCEWRIPKADNDTR